MQNVSRIQKHPDTLIKNFFIGGLTQRKLQSDIFPKDSKRKQDMFNLEPEMLFSLYEEPEKMAAYLGQVFPDKVRILQTEKMVDPKFFTFMSVDAEGFNQYNHCLIFYERFTENLIREDFDEKAYIERLVRKREKIEYVQKQKEELAGIAGNNGGQQNAERSPSDATDAQAASFGRAGELRIARRRMDRVFIKTDHLEVQPQDNEKKTVLQELTQMRTEIASRQTESGSRRQFTQTQNRGKQNLGTPTGAQVRAQMGKSMGNIDNDGSSPLLKCDRVKNGIKNGLEEMKQGIVSGWNKLSKNKGFGSTQQQQTTSTMPTVQETVEENMPASLGQSTHKLGSVVIAEEDAEEDEDNYRDSLFGKTREEAQPEGLNGSSMYSKRPSHNIKSQETAQKTGQMDFSDLVKANSLQTEQTESSPIGKRSMPEIVIDQTPREWRNAQQNPSKASAHSSAAVTNLQPQNQNSSNRQSDASFNLLHKGEYYFAPIAFVIQTEVEHHDIFKEVLLSLFESIRKPEEICNTKQKDRQLAFADFLCHLAFLASIPCPTFNTRYHIEFFNKTLTVAEPNYDEIPDKNQLAIRVLFDMLDVRTIIYCWKAILFDQTLVLISSQYSLQFYIAQALLQLVFPLTFQYSYVQPASAARIGMVQSPFPILFACSHLVQDFEYFEELGKDHIAICDIDGSYTNNIEFPQLEDEKKILRSLSALKNFKGAKFDSAFHEMYQEDLINSDKQFTIEVRNVFFGILDQFLNLLPSGDYFKALDKDQEKAFINYFDQDQYLDWFEGTKNYEFAKRLMNSQLFATFCDDHFDRDVSNMLIYLNISSNGFNFQEYDAKDRTMKDAFEERMANIWREIDESSSNEKLSKMSHNRDELDAKLNIRSQMTSSKKSLDSLGRVMNEIEKNQKCNLQGKGLEGCVRAPNCELVKDWPQFQKIDICWRMPLDNQRVMIFEKLEYALKCYDRDREHCKKYMDQNEQLFDDNHREHMNNLFRKITDVKKLYREKLPMYTTQIKWAAKDLDNAMIWGDSASQSQNSDSLKAMPNFHRMKTQIDKTKEQNNNDLLEGQSSSDDPKLEIANQSSQPSNNMLASSQENNVSQQDMKFLHLSEIENDNDSVDIGQLNRSTRQNGNLNTPVKLDEMIPRQRSQHHKRGPSKDFVQATQEFAENQLKLIGDEQLTMAEVFWRQREENVSYFCHNRIVEICYGLNGLIDFLDLLFTQFPSKRQVKAKFNYYFALRKQIQAIEKQVTNELLRSENQKINSWFTNHKGLLEQLQPQASCMQTNSNPSLPQLELKPGVSIVFQGPQGEVCGSKNLERSTSIRLWDMQDAKYNPLEIQGGPIHVFSQQNIKNDVWMLPVLPEQVPVEPESNEYLSTLEKLVAFRTSYQYISLKQKLFFAFEDQEDAILLIFGEFLLFSQRDRQIFPTYRFYELLEVMTQPQKNRIFKKIVKHLNAKDEIIFQLRLMFEHERNGMDADRDEPVSLDHTLFDQDFLVEKPKRILQHGKTFEVQKANEFLSLPKHQQMVNQKHSLQKSSRQNAQNSPCMSKRKTTSSEVQHLQSLTKEMQTKMKKDKNRVATTGQGTTRQIQGISPRTTSGKNQTPSSLQQSAANIQQSTDPSRSELNQTQDGDDDTFEFMSRSQAADQHPNCRNLALNGTITSLHNNGGQSSVKSSMNFDKEGFMRAHADSEKVVINPEKRAKKLLLQLIDLYTEVFDPSIFSEVQQKIIVTDAIPQLIEKLKNLRKLEEQKLGSVKLVFEGIFDAPEAKQDQEIIKRCFWINLFNYKILLKVLEVLLTKPRTLHRLSNCTMFVCFMSSVKVKVMGHMISCYEIFKTMLKHEDIHLLTGAFEDPVRTLEQMPPEIQELAVENSHNLASFGLFLPIKKWSNFTVYEKDTFESQLRKVIQSQNERMFISPENFLIRIPKIFFRVHGKDERMRLTQTEGSIEKNDAIGILKKLVDENIIEPNFDSDSVYNSIVTVLNQIENEERSGMETNAVGEHTSHVCEIDNFWWKFDLLFVRSNIREYCVQSGRNQQPIKSTNDSRFGTIAEVAESDSQVQQRH